MDWTERGLDAEIDAWLKDAAKTRYVRDKRLDPFATSMRDFDDVSPNLRAIRANGQPAVSDVGQRIVDLKNAGFVVDDGTALTDLGSVVLKAWENYDVATKDKNDELARHVLTVLESRRIGDAQYNEYADYWRELRASFDAIELIDNWDALYALNYLDFERMGFAPGKVYRLQDKPVPLNDIEFDLLDYALQAGLSEDAKKGAERIQAAIGGKVPRGRHRATLAMALEIIESNGLSANVILNRFGQPQRPRKWAKFNQAQKEKILRIINDYSLSIGIATTAAVAVGATNPGEATEKMPLPDAFDDIDFSQVLVPPPKPAKASSGGANGGVSSKKTDYKKKAEDDAAVGAAGEKFALAYERWRLREHAHLLEKIEHVSLEDDTLGYDIRSFETDGAERFVEVKATLGTLTSRFFITANELDCAEKKGKSYVLLRIGGLASKPTCCEIPYPFAETLNLVPATYQAVFAPEQEASK